MTAFTPAELAKRWKCSPGVVYNMIESGGLPAFRLGRKLLRVRADVVEAVECQSGESHDATENSASPGMSSETTEPGSGAATGSEPPTPAKQPAAPLLSTQQLRGLKARA